MTERSEATATTVPLADPGRIRQPDQDRTVLDAMIDAILVFDPGSHIVVEANPAAATLLRRERSTIVGERFEALLRPIDTARVLDMLATLAHGDPPETVGSIGFSAGRGRTVEMEVSFRQLDAYAGRPAIIAIGRDIHERIEAQVRLQRLALAEHARAAELNAVIRSMGESVFVCGPDGTITLANPAAEELFPDVEERSYAEILSQLDDSDGLAPPLRIRGGPIQLPTRSDASRWIELSTYPVESKGGLTAAVDETIVVMRDVSEARRRELVRETFVGVLSHELRTPITTIFGGAKLLAREPSSLDAQTRREILHDIHDEAERLQRLVEDIVAMNRFGDSPGEIGWEPVLLTRLVPKVVHSEDGRWPGVKFTSTIAPDVPTVSADPTYVEQVLRNLLSNAAKYGGTPSSVSVVVDSDGHEVAVRVLDEGPGFPADETDRLFELFYRSPTTAPAAAGAGIGLFVSARLAAAMGGRIWAIPRPTGGAEFGFALPVLTE